MKNAPAASSPKPQNSVDLRPMANAIRALAMDAVEKAQSGHPGMPMGMADVATVLYSKFLKFNPQDPQWPDRDRFVLSAGHGSMLLYALNYLTGYEAVTLEQIKNFRQLGALTAGHPEVEHHAGIETTTGPLGQGISTAVGMALAERILNARFGDDLVDHYTYVIASDGDLQEGISHEACSLAGHLALRRLIVLYDDNGISIDGPTSLSFTDDTPKRFEAYGWDVQTVDGHDFDQIQAAIAKARQTSGPALICCKTHIGYGAPTKQDSASSHGSPLGTEEIKGTREKLAWPHAPFSIPEDILSWWRKVPSAPRPPETNGTPATPDSLYTKWQARLRKSDQRAEFEAALRGDVAKVIGPIIQDLKKSIAEKKPKDATRKCSGNVLEKLIPALPTLVGGSADLTGSNNTQIKGPAIVTKAGYNGQYIYYGVREHGMAAAMNGMALHGGVIPYGGTFLIFTDYCRPSIRLSALMNQRVVYVMTHDSIGLGEDGPTHQPVEHLASLRAMPNLLVFRPCDGIETAEAWELALNHKTSPSVLALTRQGLPTLAPGSAENKSAKGAYTLKESGGKPQVTLFASGSEVSLTHQAYETLVAEGYAVRLVSAPCLDLFWQQNEDYIQHFLRNDSLKIAVEAAGRESWDRILGHDGVFIGMKGFGASAPAEDLYRHFGITPDAIVDAVRDRLG